MTLSRTPAASRSVLRPRSVLLLGDGQGTPIARRTESAFVYSSSWSVNQRCKCPPMMPTVAVLSGRLHAGTEPSQALRASRHPCGLVRRAVPVVQESSPASPLFPGDSPALDCVSTSFGARSTARRDLPPENWGAFPLLGECSHSNRFHAMGEITVPPLARVWPRGSGAGLPASPWGSPSQDGPHRERGA